MKTAFLSASTESMISNKDLDVTQEGWGSTKPDPYDGISLGGGGSIRPILR